MYESLLAGIIYSVFHRSVLQKVPLNSVNYLSGNLVCGTQVDEFALQNYDMGAVVKTAAGKELAK